MWRRNCVEDSCDNLSPIIAGDTLQITNNDLNQSVSTSILTVNETAPAVWRYCCQANLTDIGVSSSLTDVLSITVTGERYMASFPYRPFIVGS